LLCVVVASVVQDDLLLSGVKGVLSSGPSNRRSSSHSSDNESQESPWSSSFVPSSYRVAGSSRYLEHDDVPDATDDNDISICTTEEMEKYESFCYREFVHTRAYNVNLLEMVGLDEDLPTILRIISWGKLYDEPHLGSRLLTLEFL
jgi:hypothetical protein